MSIFTTLLIEPLANGLIIFYKLLGQNMGMAIIGFSLFLKLALNPLTKPYMESMKRMKEVAPQLEKLKKKHKKDRAKLAQAQTELYRQKGISPGAGCLPYLLQIVVLIAFFNVFTRTLGGDGDPTGRFNDLLYQPLKFAEGYSLNTRFLYFDITKPDVFNFAPFPIPGPVVVLAALVQFVSAKVMAPLQEKQSKLAKKTPEPTDDFQVSMQKSMSYMFPLFTLFIGMRFASGLALYWVVFSLTQTVQQVRAQGWGSVEPWFKRFRLVYSRYSK